MLNSGGNNMFNAEQLLGKILQETLGSGSGKKKNRRGGNGLLDSLTSGSGLMTAIGLGVGAYEILKEQKKGTAGIAGKISTPPPVPGSTGSTGSEAPTPPSPGADSPRSTPPPPPGAGKNSAPGGLSADALARRMIQVMIAAAHADGTLDEAEEKAILDRLRGADLDGEEKMFLVDELHRPKSIDELTGGIEDRSTAEAMYMLAVAAIEVDTEAERSWLDELGARLGLSPEVKRFIEEQG